MDTHDTTSSALGPSLAYSSLLLPEGDALPELDVRFGYTIGNCPFVLDKYLLTEIVIRPRIYSIPHSPAWFPGVINLRGNIIAVLDLSETLGTVYSTNPGDFVLIVDKGREALGIIIDGTPRRLGEIQAQAETPTPFSPCAQYFSPGVRASDTNWQQLDVKALAMDLRNHS